MSEQSIGRLIEEAREYVPSESFIRDYGEELIVRLSDALEAAEQERDNWKLSAEEAERAEKRWKDRAVEAERLDEARRETIREYERENEAWSVRAHTAERERDRLDAAFDRDLPWRYDEVEAQRNQYAAVVEKVWQIVNSATAPDGALHEHYAALVKGMVDECAGSGREQTHGVTSMLSFLYTKARRKREEQTDV